MLLLKQKQLNIGTGIMGRIRWGLKTTAIFLVLLTASVIAAQEENEASGDFINYYYEDQAPDQLDATMILANVCLEAVIKLNPDLDINNMT
ncbi:MAG: hypothetical protein KC615_26005, partial [Anaerolineae bacterium]|nr:hypothetical protein [Anaerolineae bacterium]